MVALGGTIPSRFACLRTARLHAKQVAGEWYNKTNSSIHLYCRFSTLLRLAKVQLFFVIS